MLALPESDWSTESAPNMSYAWIMNRSDNGVPEDGGILFGRLADLQMNDISGLHVRYGGSTALWP